MPSSIYQEWRPQTFADVLGQPIATRILKNSLTSQTVSHAYMFCGAYGCGKTTCARIFAKALNCEARTAAEPCNKCRSCKAITRATSPDVLEMDGASHNGVDDARKLAESAEHQPTYSRYKVYIVDECHALSNAAWQALLKLIEEPPKHLIFIFATTDPEKLPNTIKSRCLRLDFRRIGLLDIEKSLTDICADAEQEIQQSAVSELAKAASGSLRDAQSLLEQAMRLSNGAPIKASLVRGMLGVASPALILDIVDAIASRDARAMLSILGDAYDHGLDPLLIVKGLIDHLHVLMLIALSVYKLPAKKFEDWSEQLRLLSAEDLRTLLGVLLADWDGAKSNFDRSTLLDVSLIRGIKLISHDKTKDSRTEC